MTELANSTTYSVVVGRLPLLNTFNILSPLEMADYPNLPTANWLSGYEP